jgi:hypothetical protein
MDAVWPGQRDLTRAPVSPYPLPRALQGVLPPACSPPHASLPLGCDVVQSMCVLACVHARVHARVLAFLRCQLWR